MPAAVNHSIAIRFPLGAPCVRGDAREQRPTVRCERETYATPVVRIDRIGRRCSLLFHRLVSRLNGWCPDSTAGALALTYVL